MMRKIGICSVAVLGISCVQTAAFAAPVALSNGYVNAGVSDYGTLGSNGNTSPGILYDASGTSNYGINDFLTPGTPFEGFYVSTASFGVVGNNNTGSSSFGATSPTLTGPTSATWSGSNGLFSITNDYSLTTFGGQSVIAITTTLTNISGSTQSGVNFLRTLDPDPDVNAYGSFFTSNVVLSNNQACGTGPSSGQTICIYSYDPMTHMAGVSSAWSTNPATYLAGVNSGDGDYAIGMAFDLGNLSSEESATLTYGYALGATIDAATGGSVPEPGTLALLGLGLTGIAASRRKKSRV